jgi:NAD+ kinase
MQNIPNQDTLGKRRVIIMVRQPYNSIKNTVQEAKRLLIESNFAVTLIDSTLSKKSDSKKISEVTKGAEIVIVIGGDGTILRATNLVYGTDIPILGINLGHMGFLAESEKEDLSVAIECVARKEYVIEKRDVLQVKALTNGKATQDFALNDAVIEKAARGKMVDVLIRVDNTPVTSLSCDGVVISTSTGSTAYALSGGGPIIWPDVTAQLLVPLVAYALFAKPLIISDKSAFQIEILDTTNSDAVLTLDGTRQIEIPTGSVVETHIDDWQASFARIKESNFASRLARKFGLPQKGLRDKNTT